MTISIAEACRRFLDHCRIAKRLSPNTLRAYSTDFAKFCAFASADTPAAEIDRDRLRSFARTLFDGLGLKETTVKRRMAAIKVMFKWLEQEDIVPLSPFHRLNFTLRLPRRLPRALSAVEIRCLLETAEAEAKGPGFEASLMHFVVVTLFATGLRIGELTSAMVSDVDASTGTIRVRGKGNRERAVYLPRGHASTTFARYLRARTRLVPTHAHLMISESGAPANSQVIRRLLAALADRAGITRRVTPHMLRHTAATQLIEAGVDIRFVQKLLGHASIATTQIYTQVSDASLRATLERANTVERVRKGRMG